MMCRSIPLATSGTCTDRMYRALQPGQNFKGPAQRAHAYELQPRLGPGCPAGRAASPLALNRPARRARLAFAPRCCRYVVSHGPSAVYVAFQGTKHLADWAANLRVRHAPLWEREEEGDQEQVGPPPLSDGPAMTARMRCGPRGPRQQSPQNTRP